MANDQSPVKGLQLAAVLPGMAYGVRQPVLLIQLELAKRSGTDWTAVDEVIGQFLGPEGRVDPGADVNTPYVSQFARRAIAAAARVQRQAGLPVFERGRIVGAKKSDALAATLSLAVPYALRHPMPAFSVMAWAVKTLQLLLDTGCRAEVIDASRQSLDKLAEAMTTLEPRDTNSARFFDAAYKAAVPWDWVSRNIYQFGWGVRQCWLNSSMTDRSSSIGVAMARDKLGCAQILRRAGLPVPNHAAAYTAEEARQIAGQLGYPVVVKPTNLDGGIGVAAGLTDAAQVERAWMAARSHSEHVMVEKHQAGQDYRLLVLDGKLIWAVGRLPAGVEGDGVHTIEQLVGTANQDPRRSLKPGATLRPLSINDEAMELLAEAGFALSSVPLAGQFIRLRRAANISSGGTPMVVNEQVHPDNRCLAERAVAALDLDLAGVDLVIPDIAVSWQDSGAGIIEINAQPQLVAASQTHLYGQILAARVSRGGRIPVFLLLGGEACVDLARRLSARAGEAGRMLGVACAHGAWRGIELLGPKPDSAFDAGRALLADRGVEALLMVVTDEGLLKTGLPFDAYDHLMVLSGTVEGGDARRQWMAGVLSLALPHCRGQIRADSERAAEVLRARAGPARSVAVLGAKAAGLEEGLMGWLSSGLEAAGLALTYPEENLGAKAE